MSVEHSSIKDTNRCVDSGVIKTQGMFYLMTHSIHFIYGYMASDKSSNSPDLGNVQRGAEDIRWNSYTSIKLIWCQRFETFSESCRNVFILLHVNYELYRKHQPNVLNILLNGSDIRNMAVWWIRKNKKTPQMYIINKLCVGFFMFCFLLLCYGSSSPPPPPPPPPPLHTHTHVQC